MSSPNQKTIRFANSPKDNICHFYSRYNNADLIKAQLTLSDSAFRLYIYLGMNKERDKLELSREDVMNKTGISSRSYTNAVKELQELGYIVRDPTKDSSLHFVCIESGLT